MEVIIIYYIFEYKIYYIQNFRYIDIDVSRKEVLFIAKMNGIYHICTGGGNMPGTDIDFDD